jgi:hypothetical protein
MTPFNAKRAMLLNYARLRLVDSRGEAELQIGKPYEIVPYPVQQSYLCMHELSDDYFFDITHAEQSGLSQDDVIFSKRLSVLMVQQGVRS